MAASERSRAREALRASAGSSKKFRNAIHHLNCLAKQTTDVLEDKNKKKLTHLSNKQNSIRTANGEITISTKTKHKYESKYPNLSIYRESGDDDAKIQEEMRILKQNENAIILGEVEADEDEKEVLMMNPKKPIQLEPNLPDFQVEMEMCFCKTRWSLLNAEKFNTSHLEGIPWEELEELDKQKFIEKKAEMRRLFSREHKCIRLNNLRVMDSRFNAHITLPKALQQDKEVYINLRREVFTRTMKKYLKKYERNKIKMNLTKKQFRGYKKLKKRLKNNEFKMAQTDKSNHLAMIDYGKYKEMGSEHTSKDCKISLEEAMELAKKNDQHTSMLLKIFNMGQNMKEMKCFRESYLNHENISHKEDLYKDHKKGHKTRPVINGSGAFSAGGGELYCLVLTGITALKEGKKSVSSTKEMMRAVESINEMVKENKWKIYNESEDEKFRKEMEENPEKDTPIIMVATDAVALYPSLEKFKTASRIRRFIEKSEVNFEDINVSEALVYLKLNEHILKKQDSFKEVRGFLPTPKNGKE